MYQMTPEENEYWEGFIAAIPAAQSRFIGVKFITGKPEPEFIPNFNTLFNQFLREYATDNENTLNKQYKEKLLNNKDILRQTAWFQEYYYECYVNLEDDII
jgi:hypothetical protein